MTAVDTERPRLLADGVSVDFAGLRAVDRVSLKLERGRILGLIGPNGAGKTTLINALTGFQRPTEGVVHIGDRNATAWSPQRRAHAGLARTFQNVRLFPRLTVLENVAVGAVELGARRNKAERRAWELLERMNLVDIALSDAHSLPHGDERRIGILRALATEPSFLLLDEPAAGLNEAESDELVHVLAMLPIDFSLGLLVIEHDMRLIMQLCEEIQVLDHGRTIALGTPASIRTDQDVLAAYLGTKRASDASG